MKAVIAAYIPNSDTVKGAIVGLVSFVVVFIGASHLHGNPINFASISNTDPTDLITNLAVFSLGAVTIYYIISFLES